MAGDTDTHASATHPPGTGPRAWVARLGAAAFLFFLVKGLFWTALAVAAWMIW